MAAAAAEVRWIGGVILILMLIHSVVGWGKDGHFAICKVAQKYLSGDALTQVRKLLPRTAEGDLAAICSWADEVRFHYYWSRALHYVDTPDFWCNYRYCRDCHDTRYRKDRCVTGAIYNYTKQLEESYNGSNAIKKYNLTEALMFLSHFVGDVHQPLHVGFTGDEGGNSIELRWYRRKTNLHHVWDNLIIESAVRDFYDKDLSNMIQAIQNNITDGSFSDSAAWPNCASNMTVCPDPYASESVKFACKYAYRNATPGSTLGDGYFLSRLPIVEKRLAQGGVRLAATLNRIFAKHPLIAEE